MLRAVALAHRETGTPITVHTHPGTQQGLAVKKVLESEGIDPRRVVLGHSGDTTDTDHLSELADAGFVLGMDRFGLNLGLLPYLLEHGVTQEQIDTMLVDNPRRYFETAGGRPGRSPV